jgi:hypothetical protein
VTDGTHVELDELAALNTTFRELSGSIRRTADTTTGIHYGANMFGGFAWAVASAATETAGRTARGLYALASNVLTDAENVASSATDFADTEQTQTARFRRDDDG